MKLQTIRTIDFSKANKQIKDLQHKFLQSKMLRKNKENCNPNNLDAAARLLLEALLKPIQRNFKDLVRIKESVVCERNIFDEVCSLGLSENSEIGEGFKISFANLSIKQESIVDCESIQATNAPILLFMMLSNLRKKKMMISFQEIKFFILQRNLTSVNKRLQYAKREQLRKIVVNKMKQEELLMQVYLKYWSQQTQLLNFFDHFGSKIKKIYINKLAQHFYALNDESYKKQGTIKLVKIIQKKFFEYGKTIKQVSKNLHLQKCFQRIYKRQLTSSFQNLKQNSKTKSPIIFELLIEFQNKLLKQCTKILFLYSLRQKRRLKSISFGLQDLEKTFDKINQRYAFNKLQSKNQNKKIMLPTKYLVMILKKIQDKQKNWVLRKLNQ